MSKHRMCNSSEFGWMMFVMIFMMISFLEATSKEGQTVGNYLLTRDAGGKANLLINSFSAKYYIDSESNIVVVGNSTTCKDESHPCINVNQVISSAVRELQELIDQQEGKLENFTMTIVIRGQIIIHNINFDFSNYSNRFEMIWQGRDNQLFSVVGEFLSSTVMDAFTIVDGNLAGGVLFHNHEMDSFKLIHCRNDDLGITLNIRLRILEMMDCKFTRYFEFHNLIENIFIENTQIIEATMGLKNSKLIEISNSKVDGVISLLNFGSFTMKNSTWIYRPLQNFLRVSQFNLGEKVTITDTVVQCVILFSFLNIIELNRITVESTKSNSLLQMITISQIIVKGSTFSSNTASKTLLSLQMVNELTIENCKVFNNTGSFLRFNDNPSLNIIPISIINSSFIGNTLTQDSSLLELFDQTKFSYKLQITNCKFIENNGATKGSIYIYGTDTRIENTLFSRNEATLGGSVYVEQMPYAYLVILNSSFVKNYAEKGAALYLSSVAVKTENVICDSNMATYSGGCFYFEDKISKVSVIGNNIAYAYGPNIATPLQNIAIELGEDVYTENAIQVFPGQSFKMRILVTDLYNQTTRTLLDPNTLIIRPENVENAFVSLNSLHDNTSILVNLQVFPYQPSNEFNLSIIVTPNIEKIVKVKMLPCSNSYVLKNSESGYTCEYSPFIVILVSAILGSVSLSIILGALVYAVIIITRKLLKLRKQELAEIEIEKKFTDSEFVFENEQNPLLTNSGNSGSSINHSTHESNSQKKQQYIIPIAEIKILKRIGEGAMGVVYLAKWNRTDVAVKQLKTDANEEEFENEAILMSSLRHPFIVNCYGVSLTTNGKYMITEYLENSSLEKAIYYSRIGRQILKFETKVKILIDISKGLIYLHSIKPHKIVHRDLKPGNILLDKNMNAKVGDFGLSKIVSNNTSTMTSNVGTLLYMAPELLSDNIRGKSTKVDIYSFGILMWELLYEILPFSNEVDNFTNAFQILMRVAKGHRPELLHLKSFNENHVNEWIDHNFTKKQIDTFGRGDIIGFSQTYIQIMEKCWHHDPSQRPEFIEIIDMLEELLQSLE